MSASATIAGARKTKRGNGEGSITQLSDGRWQARVTLEDGKRKAFYGTTRAESATKLNTALRERDRGTLIVSEKQTLGQYLESWLETMKPTIRPRTWRRYSELMGLHVIPRLGMLALAKVTPQQVERLYSAKLSEGLSSTTVHHLHTVLHKAFVQAERLGLVSRNACDLVKAPRMADHEMQVLDKGQVRTLLTTAKGDRLEALYVLAVTTGMRQGELLALRWRDVDLPRRRLHVQQGRTRVAHGFKSDHPKTDAGRRLIVLTPAAMDALRAHRTRQHAERLCLGRHWHDLDLVFPSTVGTHINPSNLRMQWIRLVRKAEPPYITIHDLRHTAATVLLAAGVPIKVVSEMLGHADVAITMRLYQHVIPSMQESAAAVMQRELPGADILEEASKPEGAM